jgi:hypothetical protein
MSEATLAVLNGTSDETNQELGQLRVVETESGLVLKHYITDLERYTSQYTSFAVKTAQSTLEMCRVVYEAKQSLSKDDYLKFCNGIWHKSEDSTVRKYLAIGARYHDFIAHANLLPNSWTSIYLITQIPSETFEALVLSGNSLASMSGKELDSLKSIGNSDQTSSDSMQNSNATTNSIANAEVSPQARTDASADARTQVSPQANTDASTQAIADASTDTSRQASSDASTQASTDVSLQASVAINADVSSENNLQQLNSSSLSDNTNKSSEAEALAVNATNQVLQRVSQSSTNSNSFNANEDVFVPYEVVINFNQKPSDEAVLEIIESINKVKVKFKLDFEITSKETTTA